MLESYAESYEKYEGIGPPVAPLQVTPQYQKFENRRQWTFSATDVARALGVDVPADAKLAVNADPHYGNGNVTLTLTEVSVNGGEKVPAERDDIYAQPIRKVT